MDAHDTAWFSAGILSSRIYCVISITILVFDYLCTLDREVNLVWKRRLGNLATVLFLTNRYLPFIYVFFALPAYWITGRSQEACHHRDIANAVVIATGLTISELILCLRTWAIWEGSMAILGILVVVGCIKVPSVLFAVYHMLKDEHYITISPTEIVCINTITSRWSWETLTFAIILGVETVIATLTLIKAVEARQSSSRWFFKVHYMGIIYYFYNLLMTIVNVIGTIYLHNVGIESFAILQGVFQSVLCSRVIFLAREPSGFVMGTLSEQYISSHY